MLPTDDECKKQIPVNQQRDLCFKHNEAVFGPNKITRTNGIISVSLYFAKNIQKCIKPELTVHFLEKKVLQPYAEGTVEMSIAELSSSSSSSNSVALDVMTLSEAEKIFLPTSELQNLRNALHSKYDLQVKAIDCLLEPSKLFLFSILEKVSIGIGRMTVLSTRDMALSFPPPVCPEDKLTHNMIALIAHQITETLPSWERLAFASNVSCDLGYIIGQAAAKLRFGLPQLMTSLILLKRLYIVAGRKIEKGVEPIIYIRNHNIRLIFLGCLLLAGKLSDDWHYSNMDWALLFKIGLNNINCVEKCILDALNFDLFISEETYNECKNIFEKLWIPHPNSEKASPQDKT
ncbi:hypothetical protein FACS1894122_00970 [Alphaproteobacteria bacterium]|nr:hypothetical protein FACS1894122_00970 [Alphaproteobacteria bacterium]